MTVRCAQQDAPAEPVIARALVVEETPPAPTEAVRVTPQLPPPPAEVLQGAGPATRADSGTRYTVKSGETIWSIANRHKVKEADLLSLNGISDPRKLRVGVTLKIPSN